MDPANSTSTVLTVYLSLSQVAILIPFRNRHEHLPILFQHLVPMLQRQRLQFAFYVIEQVCIHTSRLGVITWTWGWDEYLIYLVVYLLCIYDVFGHTQSLVFIWSLLQLHVIRTMDKNHKLFNSTLLESKSITEMHFALLQLTKCSTKKD